MKKVLITALVVLSLVLAVSCSTNYTVKFEANGGTPAPAAQTVAAGGVVVQPVSPEKDGYKFKAWYKDEACTTEYDFTSKVNSNFKLYAGYDKIIVPVVDTFKVSFETFGGTPVPATQTVKKGGVATCPIINPVLDDYTFKGWYTDTTFTTAVDWTAVITADTVYYAKWEGGKFVTVSFNVDGGSPAYAAQTIPYGSYAVNPGDVLTVEPLTYSAPVKAGFDFLYWADETGAKYNFDTPVYANKTIKAVWNEGHFDGFVVDENGYIRGITANYASEVKLTGQMIIPDGIIGIADPSVVAGKSVLTVDALNATPAEIENLVTAIKYVELPASLEYVGDYAFAGMTNLASINVRKDPAATKGLKVLDKDVNTATFNINAEEFGTNVLNAAGSTLIATDSSTTVNLSEAKKITKGLLADYPGNIISAPKAVYVEAGVGFHATSNLIVPSITSESQFETGFGSLNSGVLFVSAESTENWDNSSLASIVLKLNNKGEILVSTEDELVAAVKFDNALIVLADNIKLTDDYIIEKENIEIDCAGFILSTKDATSCYLAGAYPFVVDVYGEKQLIEADKAMSMGSSGVLSLRADIVCKPTLSKNDICLEINNKLEGNGHSITIENQVNKEDTEAETVGLMFAYNGFANVFIKTTGCFEAVNVGFTNGDKVYNVTVESDGAGIDVLPEGNVKLVGCSVKSTAVVTYDSDNEYYVVSGYPKWDGYNNVAPCYAVLAYKSTVQIDSGTYEGEMAVMSLGGKDSGNALVTINGGTFKGGTSYESDKDSWYGGALVVYTYRTASPLACEIIVNNGTFSGSLDNRAFGNSEYGGSRLIEIKGGDFKAVTKAFGDKGSGEYFISLKGGTYGLNLNPTSTPNYCDLIANGYTSKYTGGYYVVKYDID